MCWFGGCCWQQQSDKLVRNLECSFIYISMIAFAEEIWPVEGPSRSFRRWYLLIGLLWLKKKLKFLFFSNFTRAYTEFLGRVIFTSVTLRHPPCSLPEALLPCKPFHLCPPTPCLTVVSSMGRSGDIHWSTGAEATCLTAPSSSPWLLTVPLWGVGPGEPLPQHPRRMKRWQAQSCVHASDS